MSYKVTRLPSDDENRDGKGAEMLVVHWIDPPLERPAAKVSFSPNGDGGIGISVKDGYVWMYTDEARSVQKAIGLVLKEYDKRRKRKPTQKEVDEFIGDSAGSLTLNRNATANVLATAKWRKRKGGGVEVWYGKKWLHLCRTDLLDDVRAWTTAGDGNPHHIDHYRKKVAYGARITDDAFYVVDSMTDG